MKIIFFGAGSFALNIWQQLSAEPEFYVDEYLAFADNNPKLWGRLLGEKKIIAPYDIENYEIDLVVITSIYEKEIRNQLINDLNIPFEKVFTYSEYLRRSYADWVYRERYGSSDVEKMKLENSFTEHIVIYTAITGNYDTLKEPMFVADNITYVCFTNNLNLKSEVWNIEYISDDQMDDVYLSKHIKMNPHFYFPDYEISIWVDGKYQIMDDFRAYVNRYKRNSSILCFPHPSRQCICDELAACILWTKANKKNMITQISGYLKDGYPLNNGLYEGGCIVRWHNDDTVKKLMGRWEEEVIRYSFRDQLSFPYVCWKNGFVPDICNLDINRNQWLLQRRTLY